MLEIDGSYEEGGGQILRTSVALSALTGTPVRITNIRAKRCNPGLAPQHLKGIEALAELCDAKLEGAKLNSTEVEFTPGKIKGGKYTIDIGTAGAVTLVLQALVLPAIHAKEEVELEITGGTDVLWGPTTAYFENVFCYFLNKMGVEIHAQTAKHGFFPKGGGKIKVAIKPAKEIRPLYLTKRETPEKIEILSIASESLKNANVAERQAEGAQKILKNSGATAKYVSSPPQGSSFLVMARYNNTMLGATAVGEKGKPAENVGGEAATLLKKQIDSGACLDEWMADQILPFLAVAGGKISVSEITRHARTNIWVIESFFGKSFSIDEKAGTIEVIEPVKITMQ